MDSKESKAEQHTEIHPAYWAFLVDAFFYVCVCDELNFVRAGGWGI